MEAGMAMLLSGLLSSRSANCSSTKATFGITNHDNSRTFRQSGTICPARRVRRSTGNRIDRQEALMTAHQPSHATALKSPKMGAGHPPQWVGGQPHPNHPPPTSEKEKEKSKMEKRTYVRRYT